MGSSVRIELDRNGVGDLLRSSEVQSMLMRKAEAVKSAALGRGVTVNGPAGDETLPIEVVDAGSDRARALVTVDHPAGLYVEAKHRLLVGSLEAARSA